MACGACMARAHACRSSWLVAVGCMGPHWLPLLLIGGRPQAEVCAWRAARQPHDVPRQHARFPLTLAQPRPRRGRRLGPRAARRLGARRPPAVAASPSLERAPLGVWRSRGCSRRPSLRFWWRAWRAAAGAAPPAPAPAPLPKRPLQATRPAPAAGAAAPPPLLPAPPCPATVLSRWWTCLEVYYLVVATPRSRAIADRVASSAQPRLCAKGSNDTAKNCFVSVSLASLAWLVLCWGDVWPVQLLVLLRAELGSRAAVLFVVRASHRTCWPSDDRSSKWLSSWSIALVCARSVDSTCRMWGDMGGGPQRTRRFWRWGVLSARGYS